MKVNNGPRAISRRDLANLWNVSPNTIDVWRQQGKLRAVHVGYFDLDHAERYRASMDPAALERESNKRLARGLQAPGAAAAPAADAEPEADDAGDAPGATSTNSPLFRARTAKVVADARLAQVRLREAEGLLVSRGLVRRQSYEAGALLVARLRALPRRLGPLLAATPDAAECVALIEAEMDEIAAEVREHLLRAGDA